MAKRKPSTVQRLLTTPRRTSLKPASKEPSLESLVSWCGSSSRICKPMLIRENLCSSHWSIGQFSVHHRLSFMKNLINALVTTFLSQTKKKSAKTNAPITFQHLERLSFPQHKSMPRSTESQRSMPGLTNGGKDQETHSLKETIDG